MKRIEVFFPGVYRIKCNSTSREYIGQSQNVFLRIASHINLLNSKRHINIGLQNDWNQYGPDAFSFDLIKRIDCARERCKLEGSIISNPRLRGTFYNNTVIKKPVPQKCPAKRRARERFHSKPR